MQRVRRIIVVGVIAASQVAAGCGGAPDANTARGVRVAVRPHGQATTAATAEAGVGMRAKLIVDVAGEVRRPGVYSLPAGSRVLHAIRAAGGARATADLASINRAAPVVDGQQILVGTRASAASQSTDAAPTMAGARLSINQADVSALDELPGIGPVTAQHIVDERTAHGPFTGVDDLTRVDGIGPATIDALRDSVTA